jgi:hypothetical protein
MTHLPRSSPPPKAGQPQLSPPPILPPFDRRGIRVPHFSSPTPQNRVNSRRKKKTADETVPLAPTESTIARADPSNAPQASTDAKAEVAPVKPKRTRRVGEPKPKRYPVGEPESEQGA